tara:strand:- start:25551 stop:26048 length:498 start_codon:yes stop_codon:yes gene_type:complete
MNYNKDECLDLKNIQYKTMLLNGKTTNLSSVPNTDASLIDKRLETEMNVSKNLTWTKLDRGDKLKKLKEYSTNYIIKNNLEIETDALYQYLVNSLDRNRLQKIKEVTYDKNTGIIESIPNLVFNAKTSKFTLKRSDKRTSTLSSLSSGNKTTRKRVTKDLIDKLN